MRWRSWQESKILPKSFITQLSIENDSLQCNTWRCLGLTGAEAGRADPQPMRTEAKSAAPWNLWRAKTTWDSVAAAYWLAILLPPPLKPCPKASRFGHNFIFWSPDPNPTKTSLFTVHSDDEIQGAPNGRSSGKAQTPMPALQGHHQCACPCHRSRLVRS